MSLLGTILTSLTQVGRLVGRPFREWSEWAAAHPGPAAIQLALIAARLDGRADAIEKKRGPNAWRVRKNRGLASRLRKQATALIAGDLAARKVPPGQWKEAP
jgi:hypothetical protein